MNEGQSYHWSHKQSTTWRTTENIMTEIDNVQKLTLMIKIKATCCTSSYAHHSSWTLGLVECACFQLTYTNSFSDGALTAISGVNCADYVRETGHCCKLPFNLGLFFHCGRKPTYRLPMGMMPSKMPGIRDGCDILDQQDEKKTELSHELSQHA